MIRSFLFSLGLHVFLFVLMLVGLPSFHHEEETHEVPLTFEVIAEETMTPTPAPQRVEAPSPPQPAPAPIPEPKPLPKPDVKEPEKAPPPPEEEPEKTPEDQTPEPKPEPDEKKPEEAPQVLPIPEVKSQQEKPKEVRDKKIPRPQIKPSPQSNPEEKEKGKNTPDFTSVLKDLKKMKEKAHQKDKNESPKESPEEGNVGKLGEHLSASELDAVKSRLQKCWNVSSGAKDAQNLKVKVHLWMNPDGTVKKAKILRDIFLQNNPFYKIATDRVLNAVLDPACQPLPLSKNKFEIWKEMELEFDPKEMFGGN